MESGELKKSMQEIGRVAMAMVEDKLGDRSKMEEQVRTFAKQIEDMFGDALKTASQNLAMAGAVAGAAAKEAAANVAANMAAKSEANASSFSSASPHGKITLKFKKLAHFKGELPAYQTEGSSGLDIRARIDEPIALAPGDRALIATGLSTEIPLGYEIQVRPRSGLAVKKGLTIVNTPGTVDADYRGEIKVILINLGQESFVIQDQERIAQLVVCPVIQADIELAEDLSETGRGAGGFGSTGV